MNIAGVRPIIDSQLNSQSKTLPFKKPTLDLMATLVDLNSVIEQFLENDSDMTKQNSDDFTRVLDDINDAESMSLEMA